MKTNTTLFVGLFLCLTLSFTTQIKAQNLNVEGNATAAKFIGDGSMLTNIDKDTLNELQALMLSGDTLMLSKDTTNVDLSAFINNWTLADGKDVAFGYNNLATGDSSSALGVLNTATGDRSSGIGYFNEVTGAFSSAIGIFNTVDKSYSGAIGVFNIVNEERSSALGYSNAARMIECSAVGVFNEATGNQSSAMGYFNEATAGDAFGHFNKAIGGSAFGRGNQATGNQSNAVGYSNKAAGLQSSAFGYINEAIADESSAFGHYTVSNIYGLMAVGRYNVNLVGSTDTWISTDPVFVIGNGENASTRSTALTILKNGKVGIGTQNPNEKLEISSDDANVTRIGVTNTSTGNATLRAKTTNSDYGWYSRGANNSFRLFDFDANEDRMTVDSIGNVGIGTTSPTQKLHVAGEGLVNSTSSDPTFVIQNDTEKADLRLKRGAATGGIQLNASGGALGLTGAAGGANLIQFRTYGASYFNGGNVGIGTTNPDVANLTVKSDAGIGIATRDAISGNYWAVGTGNPSNNYKFSYNAANNFVADIDAITGAYNQLSDRNRKKNIEQLEEVLPKVMQLTPTRYHFKRQKNAELKSWGFVAQEVEQIFPSFVSTTMDGGKEQKGIAYYNFSVLAIKAIQELKGELEETKSNNEEVVSQNEVLQQKNKDLEARLSNLEAKMEAFMNSCCQIESVEGTKIESLTSATLQQNAPNPFSEVTTISYFIPEHIKSASLQVLDQNGRIIKTIPIQATGKGQITLQANLLSAGTYSYSLVLDGQVMETKQMVLTH